MLIVWSVVAPSGSAADGDHVELRPTANTGLIDAVDVVTNSRFTFRSLSVCRGSTKVGLLTYIPDRRRSDVITKEANDEDDE
jgi:hypothetical protein